MPRLRRVDCSSAGIRRVGRGLGFSYEEADGATIQDREVLERIRELAVPPAWKEVWICPYPNGHIQATGYDEAGRKQYLYHPQWRADRDRDKFAEMERFARSLPGMRERTGKDLARRGLVRERVLGCAVRLLDLGFFRIGSERYTEENETFGLATLRRRHVAISGGVASFHYKAKGAKDHRQEIADPVLVPTLRKLKEREGGGYELLAYRQGRSGWHDVRAIEINEYLKDVTGGDYSAKDFRTWNATVLAAVALGVSGEAALTSKTAHKRATKRAIEEVARFLGNTPAVCRASYIDPRVFDCLDAGVTIADALPVRAEPDLDDATVRARVERAVLDLLSDEDLPAA
jgi:DNA topoisomerase I